MSIVNTFYLIQSLIIASSILSIPTSKMPTVSAKFNKIFVEEITRYELQLSKPLLKNFEIGNKRTVQLDSRLSNGMTELPNNFVTCNFKFTN
jgi:hypothetical protein